MREIRNWKLNKLFTGLAIVSLFAAGCKSTKETTTTTTEVETVDTLESITLEEIKLRPEYQGSYTRHHDLLHTKLDVRFDWENQYLNGKAELTLVPYFYPTKTLTLDAKGFDIKKVAMVEGREQKDLKYDYDDFKLRIRLGKELTRKDTFKVFIEYTAKPEELPEGGSQAITSDKGLYFINPLGEEEGKPQQIWTQGETEASSCWFPTIDAPNEKTTQELAITVDNRFVTLSNGVKVDSKTNRDGTRTDFWKQEKPHAPYLFMMAIGEFAVVKDKWKDIDVNYLVEPEYEPYAKQIFGNTPEMMTYYSDALGMEYPWAKYSQVVVRDFVSGAMENTSATLHGEFLQRTDRELLDENYEDIISHELFHHWFGDLVTCESWANLPLNESFATYGEYLWREYKYGRDAADDHLQDDLSKYFQDVASAGRKDMIRFNYEDKEDMFDMHSYSKGGRILHMLRKYVGDDAFFSSLQIYLERNKFTDVEIHELRLAFEDVTGEDLNWFFNQWFLDKGHPELEFNYDYANGMAKVTINQNQDLEKNPLYKLPMVVDVYVNGEVERHDITLEATEQTFEFPASVKPDLVNVDAEKMLLAKIDDNKSIEEYIFQYKNAPLYLDRFEALDELAFSSKEAAVQTIISALDDPYYALRAKAISSLMTASDSWKAKVKSKMMDLAKNDEKSAVRAAAINFISDAYEQDPEVMALYEKGIDDRAFSVVSAALKSINEVDKEKGVKAARKAERGARSSLLYTIGSILSESGDQDDLQFFLRSYSKVTDFGSKYGFASIIGDYLVNQPANIIVEGLDLVENIVMNENTWFMRLAGAQSLSAIYNEVNDRINEASSGDGANVDLESLRNLKAQVEAIAAKAKEKEENETVMVYLNSIG